MWTMISLYGTTVFAMMGNTTRAHRMGVILFCLILLFFTSATGAYGSAVDQVMNSLAPPDRSSPRATLKTFLDSMNAALEAYKNGRREAAKTLIVPALECLNLEHEPPALKKAVGIDAALYLKEVLDRVTLPPRDDIPDSKAVQTGHVSRWTIPRTEITLSAVEHEDFEKVFLFTSNTVRNSGKFYTKIKILPYRADSGQGATLEQILSSGGWIIPHVMLTAVPEWAKVTVWNQALWQWIGLALYLAVGLIGVFLIHEYGGKMLDLLDSKFQSTLKAVLSGFLFPGALIIYAQTGLWFTIKGLHIISSNVYLPVAYVFISLTYLAALWFVGVLLKALADFIIALGRFTNGDMDIQLIRLGFDIFTIAIVIVAVMHFGDRLGLPTYSLVAGLGIGGLAVALAGREALSNLIGTLMIILDRPFKIGDHITLSDGERGVVAGVGFRSTRIRTRDDILISIPNSIIANTKMINESAPDSVSRIRVKVGVAYGSDLKKVEQILLSVAKHDELVVSEPSPEIRFRQFSDSSLEFELLCWISLPAEKGRTIHRLNWAIHEAFRDAGVEIPFPQRDLHIRDST